MKLLDFSTDEAADILCTISPLIENIVKDTELRAITGEQIDIENITRIDAAFMLAEKIFTSTPILFGTHKDDIFGILAALNKKTVEEIKKQSLRETKDQIKEMLADEELRAFFTSLSQRAKTGQSTPSA